MSSAVVGSAAYQTGSLSANWIPISDVLKMLTGT